MSSNRSSSSSSSNHEREQQRNAEIQCFGRLVNLTDAFFHNPLNNGKYFENAIIEFRPQNLEYNVRYSFPGSNNRTRGHIHIRINENDDGEEDDHMLEVFDTFQSPDFDLGSSLDFTFPWVDFLDDPFMETIMFKIWLKMDRRNKTQDDFWNEFMATSQQFTIEYNELVASSLPNRMYNMLLAGHSRTANSLPQSQRELFGSSEVRRIIYKKVYDDSINELIEKYTL